MAKPTPTFYVFHGTDEFTRAETLADFKSKLGPHDTVDLNTTILDGKTLTLAELRHACDAIPFGRTGNSPPPRKHPWTP
jgi:DNA polymerase III delta subunit